MTVACPGAGLASGRCVGGWTTTGKYEGNLFSENLSCSGALQILSCIIFSFEGRYYDKGTEGQRDLSTELEEKKKSNNQNLNSQVWWLKH